MKESLFLKDNNIESIIDNKNAIEFDLFKEKELRDCLVNLVTKLKEKINNPETIYDTILSDDVSARPISLLFKKIIDKQREKFNKSNVNLYFIAGGRKRDQKIYSQFDNFLKNTQKLGRVLFITEYIETGQSLMKLVEILNKNRINYDIGAVSVFSSNTTYEGEPIIKEPSAVYPSALTEHLIYGELGRTALFQLYHHEKKKDIGVEKTDQSIFPKKSSTFNTEAIRESRREITDFANKLYNEVFNGVI